MIAMRTFLATLIAATLLAVPATAEDYWKGVEAYRNDDYAASLREWQPLADSGHALAQTSLGYMYAKGLGVVQNQATAIRWYRLAAAQGNVSAQQYLGDIYARGTGVPQDYAEAAAWYRRAAEQNYPTAQYNLAVLLAEGMGVPRDTVQAYMWLTLAGARNRAEITPNMSEAEIAEGERLVGKWRDEHE